MGAGATNPASRPQYLDETPLIPSLPGYQVGGSAGYGGEIDPQELERREAIRKGFRINWMNMRDANTGQLLWEHHEWDCHSGHTEAYVPKEILKVRNVAREINFSSQEMMSGLKLVQRAIFNGSHLEEWNFNFGFVIPNSTNSWQQTIKAADEEEMIPAELLSGNIQLDTTFYDGSFVIMNQKILLHYT